ncbi:aldo/keto reductase [Rubellicoccus peritrichatus]|uniref:Aldo/keto reductase n=1 Tax=Rubellicoccus peritrichatus TaxID=3080537 RepID=A0AAQ3LAP0_9BACT|nr:aldo/keto reductase [Puniceicoccus sp. CR14]WOO41079.1 aldo/keto reductase [Puniceicoccus sp. CR14]
MKNRLLGKDGYEISEIGLGCWQLGGSWGPTLDKDTAFSIMLAAVDNGVTFFDTANVYGSGRSEELIGEFMRKQNLSLTVATKLGRTPDAYPDKYSEAVLRRSVEGSLKRLGVEALDLIQLHCVPMEVLQRGEIFDWLRLLKQEGLIKHFGASVETVEEGLLCTKQEGLLSLQVIFNVYRQKLVDELLPQAKEKGVGIIVRLPLASGLLSGKFTKETIFPEDDHRNFNQNGEAFNVGETFAGIPFETGVDLTDQLKAFVPEGMSLAQMSQRWILDHEAVSTIIPGASSASQAERNAGISNLNPLSPELHKALSEFYTANVQKHIRGPY